MGSHPLFTFLFEGFNAFRCDAVVPTSSFSFWLVPIVLYPSIGLHAMHDGVEGAGFPFDFIARAFTYLVDDVVAVAVPITEDG